MADKESLDIFDEAMAEGVDDDSAAIFDAAMGGDEIEETINEDEYEDISTFGGTAINLGKGAVKGLQKVGDAVIGGVQGTGELAGQGIRKMTGMMSPEEEAAFMAEQRGFQDKVVDTKDAIVQSVKEDPLGAAKVGVDIGGEIVFTGMGATAFGGAGAIPMNMAWKMISDALGLRDGELGIQRTTDDIAMETGENLSIDLLMTKLGKGFGNKKDLNPIEQYTRKRMDRSAFFNSKDDLNLKLYGDNASKVSKDHLKFSSDLLGDDIAQKVLAKHGSIENIPSLTVSDDITEVLSGTYDVAKRTRSGGMIDDFGQAVNDVVEKSAAKVKFADIDSITNRAFNLDPSDIDSDIFKLKKGLQAPYYKKIAKKAGLDASDVEQYLDDLTLKAKVQKAKVRKGKLSVDEIREYQLADGRINTFRADVKDVELSAKEFFDIVRDETNESVFKKSAAELTGDEAKKLQSFRKTAKDFVEEGMSEADRTAYQLANDKYFASLRLQEAIDPARMAELKAAHNNNYAVLEGIRFGRDIVFGNTPSAAQQYDLLISSLQAGEKATMLSNALRKGILDPMLPRSDTLADFFRLESVVGINRGMDRLGQMAEDTQLSSEDSLFYDRLLDSRDQVVEAIKLGETLDKAGQKQLFKDLLTNPATANFARMVRTIETPHTKGIPVIDNEFLTQKDETQYRDNVLNDTALNSIQKGKLINHLNKFGKITTLPSDTEDITSHEAEEAEKEKVRSESLRELRMIKSSKQLVEENSMESLVNSN